jgi:hypothetical protein
VSDTARKLVRHLIQAQIDNPDHIHLICPLTETHSLLLLAAEELFGKPAADIEAQIDKQRAEIESYRTLVAGEVRQRDKAEKYERALNEIAYDHPASGRDVARKALGDES